jgi:D-arginine dehydrogenase
MIRELVPHAEIRRLIWHGKQFLNAPPAAFPASPGFRRVGSLLLASGSQVRDLASWIETDRREDPDIRILSPREVRSWIGVIDPASMEIVAHTGSDGVVDIHALLHGFLAAARSGGTEMRFHARVTEIASRNGRVTGVRTEDGELHECDTLINAAGPWAAGVAAQAGAARLPLMTLRRHLAQSEALHEIDTSWPFVWDITHEVYFRPESGGVLLCPCDEDPIEPCDPPVDRNQIESLAEKVALSFPGLKNVGLRRTWACIRTFAEDRQIVVGPDPLLGGFFWVAGLGGHGVGLAPAPTSTTAPGRTPTPTVISGVAVVQQI